MKKLFLIAPWLADFGHGIILTIILLSVFGLEPRISYFIFGIVFSVIPDLDGLKELIKFKNIGSAKGRTHDHRDGLHYPIIWLIVGLIFIYFEKFLGTLFLLTVMAHFLNDSWGTGWGVRWLWPFSKKNFKFFAKKDFDADQDSLMTSWSPEEKEKVTEERGNLNWLEDVYMKPTKISIIEYGTFLIAIIVLIFFICFR